MESRSVRLLVILLVSLLLVGTLVLAACGGGSTTTTKSPASTTAGSPKYGGTLRIASLSLGANIGWPATFSGAGSLQAYYETLLHSDNKGKLTGWLAQSYEIAKDKKSITFHIRKGIKFSDGSDLTAAVVKWNLAQYPTLPGAAAAGPPAGAPAKAPAPGSNIVVVDPYTVRVNFKTWDNTIPAAFGDVLPTLYIVSKAAYDKHGQAWITTHPVGTGPFTVASFAQDSSMKLVRNPNYWAKDAKGNKLPYLDGLDYTFTADATTTLMMAKAGEVDMVITISPGKQMVDYKNIGWRTHARYESNEVWVPDSGHADSPWSKLAVREAAEYAVDRVTIAKKFGYGYLKAPNQIPPRDTTAYDPNFALGRTYDPAKAKQLLAQAGYPKGFKTSLIVFPGGNRDIALAEQQYLRDVGIQAEVEFASPGKWTSYLGPQGTWHDALLEAPDPAQGPTGLGSVSFALGLFGNNWQKPPEFMQALGAATSASAPDVSLVRATTDILSKDALLIPVSEIGMARAEKPYVVAEFGTRGSSPFDPLETAWLNK